MTPSFCSELFRDFLADDASLAAGVPDNTTLVKQAISDNIKARPPSLFVAVRADAEKKHPSKLIYDVQIVIDAEVGLTARETVEAWALAIRNRIDWGAQAVADQDDTRFETLAAWIQANRTENQRTGWQIEKLRVFPSEDDYNAENGTATLSLVIPMKLTLRVPVA